MDEPSDPAGETERTETVGFTDQAKNVANSTAHPATHFLPAKLTGNGEAELDQPRWAVISFDECEAGNLTYEAAARLLAELEAKGVTGLCVVTDRTAARLAA